MKWVPSCCNLHQKHQFNFFLYNKQKRKNQVTKSNCCKKKLQYLYTENRKIRYHLNIKGVLLLPIFSISSILLESSSGSWSSSSSSPHSYIDRTRRSWSSRYLCKSPFSSSSSSSQHPSSHRRRRSPPSSPVKPFRSFRQIRRRRQSSEAQRKGKAAQKRTRRSGEQRRRKRKRIRRLRNHDDTAAITEVIVKAGGEIAPVSRCRRGSWLLYGWRIGE